MQLTAAPIILVELNTVQKVRHETLSGTTLQKIGGITFVLTFVFSEILNAY